MLLPCLTILLPCAAANLCYAVLVPLAYFQLFHTRDLHMMVLRFQCFPKIFFRLVTKLVY